MFHSEPAGGVYFVSSDMVCCPHLSPKILTDKMASENSSESPDETAALLETRPDQDEPQQCGAVSTQSESKLTLYHWTQSFNSQKVSVCFTFQHHISADSSPPEV